MMAVTVRACANLIGGFHKSEIWRSTCSLVQVHQRTEMLCWCSFEVTSLGLARDILSLRHRQFSSVSLLCAALDRVRQSPPEKRAAREFLAAEAADIVLANVAAHAAEALIEQPKIRRARRAGFP